MNKAYFVFKVPVDQLSFESVSYIFGNGNGNMISANSYKQLETVVRFINKLHDFEARVDKQICQLDYWAHIYQRFMFVPCKYLCKFYFFILKPFFQ